MTSSDSKNVSTPASRPMDGTEQAAPEPSDARTPQAVRTDRGLEFLNAGSGNSLGSGRTSGGGDPGEPEGAQADKKARS